MYEIHKGSRADMSCYSCTLTKVHTLYMPRVGADWLNETSKHCPLKSVSHQFRINMLCCILVFFNAESSPFLMDRKQSAYVKTKTFKYTSQDI